MEQLKKFEDAAKIYTGWVRKAASAKTLSEIDNAKVQGLYAYRNALAELNRCQFLLKQTAEAQRRVVVEESYKSLPGAITVNVEGETEVTPVEVKKTKRTRATAKKASKTTTKKAEK